MPVKSSWSMFPWVGPRGDWLDEGGRVLFSSGPKLSLGSQCQNLSQLWPSLPTPDTPTPQSSRQSTSRLGLQAGGVSQASPNSVRPQATCLLTSQEWLPYPSGLNLPIGGEGCSQQQPACRFVGE